MVVNGDAWGAADVLSHDFGLLEADGQTKLPVNASEVANELLQCFRRVCCQSSVICKEHLSDQHLVHLGLGAESCEVEEVFIDSGVYLNAILGLAEGVGQQTCFNPLLIEKGSDEEQLEWTVPCMNVVMEGLDHPQEFWRTTNSSQ